MRRGGSAVLTVLLLFSTLSFAKSREWQDAVVTRISAGVDGAVVAPVFSGAVMAAPTTSTYYWIRAERMTYVLRFNPMLQWHSANLTVNGKTKISIDGHNARVIDDDGKERKLPIVQKIATP